jgi:DivIVA domain-containing protein
MNQDDPEVRIAELERRLAEQKHVAGPEHRDRRPAVTPEDVHNVAFSTSARGRRGYQEKPGYSEFEVDRYLERIEATLRDPAARGGISPADIRNVTFSKPPTGKRGYDQDEVDAFLGLVEEQLSSQQGEFAPDTREPTRCLVYRLGGWDQTTPVLAIDMDTDAIRVIDLNSNTMIGSAPLAEVTAEPAQHGGIPLLIVDGPGLETLTIRATLGPGQWRRWPKSKKPTYYATDEEWLILAEKLGLASDLVDEFTPQTFVDHVIRFVQEGNPQTPTTWRTPLMLGLLVGVPGCIYWSPVLAAIGVILLILAAFAWRFGWEL